MTRRSVHIRGIDKALELSRAVRINTPNQRQFIHLDQLKDGTWRLTFTSGVVEDWSRVEALEMVREGD